MRRVRVFKKKKTVFFFNQNEYWRPNYWFWTNIRSFQCPTLNRCFSENRKRISFNPLIYGFRTFILHFLIRKSEKLSGTFFRNHFLCIIKDLKLYLKMRKILHILQFKNQIKEIIYCSFRKVIIVLNLLVKFNYRVKEGNLYEIPATTRIVQNSQLHRTSVNLLVFIKPKYFIFINLQKFWNIEEYIPFRKKKFRFSDFWLQDLLIW